LQPLIGITTATYTDDGGLTHSRAYNAIARAVARAGGLPVLIPTGIDEATLRGIYDRLDAVLLPGGPDIDPAYYGAERHPTTKVDAARDAIEVPLARWAVEDDLPLFGICRGHQVINVALGGKLIQDIPSEIETTDISHDMPRQMSRDSRLHGVDIALDSKLGAIMGSEHVAVNSLHHQVVSEVAPGMRITAYSPDGLVEATEVPGKSFALSVQWHPEDLYEGDETMLRLFEAFVEAARERAER
jgi:putative glutamine amidotransferase